jgi:hypothetical protein
MSYLAKKTTPMPLNYQPLLLVQAQMALLSMASQRVIGMALVLSFLPNTTYDLPAFGLPFILLSSLPNPSGKRSAGKSYVVFGKKDNTNAIELSAITTGTSTDGFVINGESAGDWSGYSVSSAGDVNITCAGD